jgi:hypothetical protein
MLGWITGTVMELNVPAKMLLPEAASDSSNRKSPLLKRLVSLENPI